MRIISSFSDYYDSIQGIGLDTSLVYSRNTEDCKLALPFETTRTFYGWDRSQLILFSPTLYPPKGQDYWDSEATLLFVAGKLYPVLRVFGIYKETPFTSYVYSFDAFKQYLSFFNFDIDSRYQLKYFKRGLKESDKYKYFFDFSFDVSSWMAENKLVIAKATSRTVSYGEIVANPCLKELNFQRILDPYTAYQEISMWFGGVLANNEKISDIPDKYKIQQHGFDKYSFRKLPER